MKPICNIQVYFKLSLPCLEDPSDTEKEWLSKSKTGRHLEVMTRRNAKCLSSKSLIQ